jgi:lysophospholipase-3
MVGGYVDCWYNNMAIYFNPSTNTYNFGAGVSSRVIDWGGLRGIDYLDTDFSGNGLSFTSYFGPLIKELQGVGYVAGKNLRGAPFDWRKAVDPDGMYLKMKTLIETMYTENGNLPVHILAHSMGNIHTGLMLTNVVDQAWKDKYIASFISVAAPWSGSPKALRALISGDNFGLGAGDWFSLVDPLQIAKITRQSGGVVLLTPEADYWNNTVLVKTPTRTYNADELTQLFVDMGSPITAQLKKSLDGVLMNSIKAPGVPMHCLYGVDYPTEMSFTYKEGFGKKPEIAYSEEGDGTVPDVSLRQCKKFALQQEQPVHVFEFDLADHLSVLNDDDLVKYVLDLLTE